MSERGAPLLLAALLALPAGAAVGPDTPVEVLLGRHGREQLAHELALRSYGGRSFSWERYAAWGRRLLVDCSVPDPPVGPAPSARLSTRYRCVHCHNLVREEERPAAQDPEGRERLLRAAAPARPEVRDGSFPALVPGTTFFGVVNRTSFYNGHYAKYRALRVPDGSRMNPERLPDAMQVCSRFCSAGRYLEAWEVDSLLAAFWDLELKARDLDLPPGELARLAGEVESGDAARVEAARERVRASYLRAARADLLEIPGDAPPPGADAARGALVFRASCGGCHGADVAAPEPAKLARRARDDPHFFRAPLRGTERLVGLYMPLFSAQRLSARQLADVRAYLAAAKR